MSRRRIFANLFCLLLAGGTLAVCVLFAIPDLGHGGRSKSKRDLATAAVEANGSIAKALDAYNNDLGKYPDTNEGLRVLFAKKGERTDARFNGPYMNGTYEKNCRDPWGNLLEYRSPGGFNEDGYGLWSRGPNGKDDGGKEGSDDIKNWSEK